MTLKTMGFDEIIQGAFGYRRDGKRREEKIREV